MNDSRPLSVLKVLPLEVRKSFAESILESIHNGERKSDGEKVSIYDFLDAGLFEYVTWEYDVCAITPNGGKTISVKPVGTVDVGDRLPDWPHMRAVALQAF